MSPPNMAEMGLVEDGCLDAHFHKQFHNNLRRGAVWPVPQPGTCFPSSCVGLRQCSRHWREPCKARETEVLQFLSQLR